eukprot:jgi/Botrbrau1/21453/Bobra.0216s0061.1
MATVAVSPEGSLIGIIGDEDTVTGFLLAGIGNMDIRRHSNFLIVTDKTPIKKIEDTFKELTSRDDVAILLINQHVANEIRHLIQNFTNPFPAILEIPSKEHPYDPNQDSILQRVKLMFGGELPIAAADGADERD